MENKDRRESTKDFGININEDLYIGSVMTGCSCCGPKEDGSCFLGRINDNRERGFKYLEDVRAVCHGSLTKFE